MLYNASSDCVPLRVVAYVAQGYMLCWGEGEPGWLGRKWGRVAICSAFMHTCQLKLLLGLQMTCDGSHQVINSLSLIGGGKDSHVLAAPSTLPCTAQFRFC